ncbi:hypothetical protein, partial [Pseudomonas entomophila]|uniref:hypothetical protein n=1 Tax=Pseudomonas entomophila TaxID=312306 RepID=UPI001F024478
QPVVCQTLPKFPPFAERPVYFDRCWHVPRRAVDSLGITVGAGLPRDAIVQKVSAVYRIAYP